MRSIFLESLAHVPLFLAGVPVFKKRNKKKIVPPTTVSSRMLHREGWLNTQLHKFYKATIRYGMKTKKPRTAGLVYWLFLRGSSRFL